ncbi:uncharacterized protein LOC118178258 [Oxyura jamaicensis]|uniref:uncharacterized protein LOC118178258 n=1 Tax=Oxyura jamaicensis TaxID=8884 RepID=UPI0015A65361|nr:uncharacterized protein LOC118178258 [Oxyura jamaicensis]
MGESRGRRRPLEPRLLALLLIAAGTAGTQPQPVSGVRGRWVLLSPALPNGSSVKAVEWYLWAGAGKKIPVAEFGPEGFKRPDPQDRFERRLEMPNGTALRIGGLELGDSGVYEARIRYHTSVAVEDQAFNLSVYAGPSVAEEPEYAQVLRRNPPEEDEQPPQPCAPLKTIYSEVGAGTHGLA